jgi:hypothetical protein
MQLVSLIISLVVNAGLVTLLTIRSVRRKASEEAESVSLDNDSKRVEGYIILVDDLNKRIKTVLDDMRTLEGELGAVKAKNIALEVENRRLKEENRELKLIMAKPMK